MEVVLLILKIIGICLLALLGLFLFLILSISFIPVRYRIRGRGELSETLETDAVFSWFLHILHCRIQYGKEGFQFKIRIFGIPIRIGKKKPKKEKGRKHRQKKQKSKKASSEQTKGEITEKTEAENEPENESGNASKSGASQEQEDIGEQETSGESGSIFRQKADRLRQKLQHLKRRLTGITEQLCNIKSILSEETNRNAVAALFRELKYVMKHFSPRRASGEIQFGTEDPANTGQVLGIISLFPFWYRYKISVTPDFTAESFYAKGKLSMKGHIRSIHLLRSGIRLIKNKDIHKLINQIRK